MRDRRSDEDYSRWAAYGEWGPAALLLAREGQAQKSQATQPVMTEYLVLVSDALSLGMLVGLLRTHDADGHPPRGLLRYRERSRRTRSRPQPGAPPPPRIHASEPKHRARRPVHAGIDFPSRFAISVISSLSVHCFLVVPSPPSRHPQTTSAVLRPSSASTPPLRPLRPLKIAPPRSPGSRTDRSRASEPRLGRVRGVGSPAPRFGSIGGSFFD